MTEEEAGRPGPLENLPIPGPEEWDAVVVGAGPAGSSVALELSRLGTRVLLLDRSSFPRWKVCGATLSPGVVDQLAASGLSDLLPGLRARPLKTLRLGGWSIRADLPLRGSMAISRRALDEALIRKAVANGAHFCSGARVRLGPLFPDRRVLQVRTRDGVGEVSARAVIAADGLGSGLMSQAGEPSLTRPITKRRMVGLGAVLDLTGTDFGPGVIHMAVGEAGYLGAVRDEDGNLNVAAAVDSGSLRRAGSPGRLAHSLLLEAGWPVDETFVTGDWRGTPELTRRPVRPGAERLFAVGDASGYVEPFTGEGVLWALSGARALAPIAAETRDIWDPGLLDRWSRVHASMIGRAQRVCRAITWTLARPGLSKTLLRTFSANPRLAGPVVNRVGSPLFRSA